MCGIVGYIGEKDSTSVLVDGLHSLEYRGYDSAGIAVFENGVIKVVKSKGRLANLEKKIQEVGKPVGHCGIGHTRWATHGEPSDINSHPHGNHNVSIVHNGIIENYQEIRNFLEEKGYHFESETDTETVAKLLDYYYEGNPIIAIRKVLSVIEGSYALGMLFRDFPDKIYATRKDCPLIIGVGENENFIVSDIPAILKYTRNYYLLEENEIATVTANSVEIINPIGTIEQKELMTANWNVEAAEKGGFPHFMLKEIHEQPEAVINTIKSRIVDGLPQFGLETLSDERLSALKNINIVACGTAMYAGMVGRQIIEQLARIPVNVDMASEFRYRNPILSEKDMVIIISQSGETADTLAALRLAKSRGAFTLAIVNVVGSSIAREADSVIYTWAGPEIAVASTKAYSVQLSILYLLAFRIAFANNKISKEKVKELTAQLLTVPDKMKEILDDTTKCKFCASKFQNSHNLFFIGRGLDYALSMEAALKLKEISYIHSEAYAAGELKHGPIALITANTPVVAVATQTATLEKTISNIKEVKARGAMVLLICKTSAVIGKDVADYIIRIPDLDDLFLPMLAILPAQLFAYYVAILRGCDVDKPRNLAKSVTVE